MSSSINNNEQYIQLISNFQVMKRFFEIIRRRRHWRKPAYDGQYETISGEVKVHQPSDVNEQNLGGVNLAGSDVHIQKLHWPEILVNYRRAKNTRRVGRGGRSWASLRIMKKVRQTMIKHTFAMDPFLKLVYTGINITNSAH